jgi:lipoprotein-releasing system permease protein
MNLSFFIAQRTAMSTSGSRPGVMSRIATLSVSISIAVILIALAIILGFKREITDRLIGFSAPILVSDISMGYLSGNQAIIYSEKTKDTLLHVAGVRAVTPFVLKSGIARTVEATEGITLKGVDSTFDFRFFKRQLTEGTLPLVEDSIRHKELLISARTARSLQLHVGDRIEMMFLDINQTPRRDRFKVCGIYSTGMDEMEQLALTDMRNVQRLSDYQSDEISGYELQVDAFDELPLIVERVEQRLSLSSETETVVATTLPERFPAVFDWLKAHNVNALVIIVVMLVVAFFNMTSALLILVLERTRMIGVLKALGMPNRQIRQIFLYRALFLIGKGLFIGNVFALAVCWMQRHYHLLRLDPSGYLLSEVPIAINIDYWIVLNICSVVVILILLLLPTAIISRIRPGEAIKTD